MKNKTIKAFFLSSNDFKNLSFLVKNSDFVPLIFESLERVFLKWTMSYPALSNIPLLNSCFEFFWLIKNILKRSFCLIKIGIKCFKRHFKWTVRIPKYLESGASRKGMMIAADLSFGSENFLWVLAPTLSGFVKHFISSEFDDVIYWKDSYLSKEKLKLNLETWGWN